jgi:hypothetical protein
MGITKWLIRLLALAVLVLTGLFIAFAIQPTLFFDVGAKELAHSLSGEVDGGGATECKERGDAWRCVVSIGGSSVRRYDLTVEEECWDAKPLLDEAKYQGKSESPYGEKVSGCVGFFDFTRIDDRIFGGED